MKGYVRARRLVAPSIVNRQLYRRFLAAGLAVVLGSAAAVVAATPAAAATVASDSFDRTVAAGWGTAPAGGAWSVAGGTSSSVSGGTAVVNGIAGGRSFRANLASAQGSDIVVHATFTVPDAVNFYYGVEARRLSDGSAYRSRVRIDSSRRLHSEITRLRGTSEKLLAARTLTTTVSPGQALAVELSVTGSSTVSLSSRTYAAGTTAPAWQASASDSSGSRLSGSGSLGVHGYVTSGSGTAVRTNFVSAATTTTAPVPPPPPPAPAPTSSTKGSVPVGTASYPLPSNAIYVSSSSGNDANSGSVSSPKRTVTAAISKASGAQTIVLRGGYYHESIIIPPGKPVILQNYPKEAAWFDGSRRVTNFVASGSVWRADNWTAKFDRSPTYCRGAPDGTAVGYQWINPAYPLAALARPGVDRRGRADAGVQPERGDRRQVLRRLRDQPTLPRDQPLWPHGRGQRPAAGDLAARSRRHHPRRRSATLRIVGASARGHHRLLPADDARERRDPRQRHGRGRDLPARFGPPVGDDHRQRADGLAGRTRRPAGRRQRLAAGQQRPALQPDARRPAGSRSPKPEG